MYVLDQYRGTSVSCRYTVPPKLSDPGARIELVQTVDSAIIKVVLKRPILQVGIVDADSKRPTWVQLEHLDLSQHITWRFLDTSTEEDLDAIVQHLTETEVDGKFPNLSSQPGWRVVVVRQEHTNFIEILFTWNHPHSDGMSGKIFQEDLCQALNTPETQPSQLQKVTRQSILSLPSSPPVLPPSIEDICKLPISLGYTLKMLWEEMGPTSFGSWTRSSLAKWAPFRLSPYKTQFRAFMVENDDLGRILAVCRQHKSTLTGLLHALALVSLAMQLGESGPAFEAGTTVQVRRFMPSKPPSHPDFDPEREMGNYVTLMTHEFSEALVQDIRSEIPANTTKEWDLPEKLIGQIWSVAAKVRQDIQVKLEAGFKNDTVGVMKFVGDWRKQMADTARRPRQHSWWVTGVGVFDGKPKRGTQSPSSDRDGTWAIRRAQFALSAETTAAALMIAPMTAAGEKESRLCVSISWQECICDLSVGERLVADLKRWLAQIAALSE